MLSFAKPQGDDPQDALEIDALRPGPVDQLLHLPVLGQGLDGILGIQRLLRNCPAGIHFCFFCFIVFF